MSLINSVEHLNSSNNVENTRSFKQMDGVLDGKNKLSITSRLGW